jgi:hypothetical protein
MSNFSFLLWNETNNQNNRSNSVKNETILNINDMDIVLNSKYAGSVLSIIGTIFIILSYIFLCFQVRCKKQKEIRTDFPKLSKLQAERYKDLKMGYGNDLIFCLSISEFICSVVSFFKSNSIYTSQTDTLCIVQGFLSNLFEISSICWTTTISISILLATRYSEIGKIPKFYCYFFLYSYLIPLILSVGPLLTNSYGPAGAWCWMDLRDNSDTVGLLWAIIIYVFHWLNIIFNFIAIVKAIQYFNIRAFEVREQNEKEANFLRNYCIVLKFFPIILIICWLPATTNRLYNFITDDENVILYSFHAFFSSFQGFLNSLVYSFYYRNLFRICCKTKENNDEKKMAEEEGIKEIEIQNIK